MAVERIRRLLRLAYTVQSGRVSGVDELATLAGVSRRTVFRDLEVLAASGIACTFDRREGYYTTESTTLIPPPSISEAEGAALLLAARHLLSSELFPDRQAAADAGVKLQHMLPKEIRDRCQPLVRRIAIRSESAAAIDTVRDMIPMLQRAIVDQCRTDISCDPRGRSGISSARVHPYYLVHVRRAWHLLAFVEKSSRFGLLPLQDLVSIRVTRTRFIVDANFDVDRFFDPPRRAQPNPRPHHVVTRFNNHAWGRVTGTSWHPTQRITYTQDGSMLFEVDVERLDDIAGWILSFGDSAEALEPIDLRRRIASCCEKMARAYAAKRHDQCPASQTA